MPELNDMFGNEPSGEILKIAVEKTANGVGKFLNTICSPAAVEFGLMLNDKMRYWRLNNIIRMVKKSQGKYTFIDDKLQLKVNPRIGVEIIENASWQDNDEILGMWAGLLASSITENGSDDSNLIFINIIKSLTGMQCSILNYICQNAKVIYDKNGLISSDSKWELSLERVYKIANNSDISRLDLEIDHLRSMELLTDGGFLGGGSGFHLNQEDFTKITLAPTSLALHLYARANGYKVTSDYFHEKID